MRITRDQFLELVRGVWTRDDARLRAVAVSIAGTDAQAQREVERIFGRERAATVVPDALRSMVREIEPWVSGEDLVVPQSTHAMIDRVITEQAYRDDLVERGLSPLSRLLFHGPSGTGKTSVAAVIAHELGWPLFVIPLDSIVTSYLGASSGNLRKVFDYIRTQRAVVLLDEIDAVGKGRDRGDDVGEQGRILTTLLVLLDEAQRGIGGVAHVIIATTNLREQIDSALMRRFDEEHAFQLSGPGDQVKIAARIFDRARVPAIPLPFPGGVRANRSAAEVERWARAEAKRIVLGERRERSAAE